VNRGLNPQQIYAVGGFPERTVEAINKELEQRSFVETRQEAFVETIEPVCGRFERGRTVDGEGM
jgi:hypothetical protein